MRIGVDVGGTKIEIVVLTDEGEIAYRERTPTPKHDYAGTLKAIGDLVTQAEQATGASGAVGVGIPGTVSKRTNTVKNANSVWLNGQPFADDLAKTLARNIRTANDANCFALSEAVDGSGAGFKTVFGVILGTGCGAGYIANRRVVDGPNQITGEWGHNPLPWPSASELAEARLCYCGKRSCIETWLSGAGLRSTYETIASDTLTAPEIAQQAEQGQASACAAMDLYLDRLARSLASVINVLDPDVVVFGGGLSHIETIYTELPDRLGRYVFSDRVETAIRKNHFGDSSGVRGAAWLWDDEEK